MPERTTAWSPDHYGFPTAESAQTPMAPVPPRSKVDVRAMDEPHTLPRESRSSLATFARGGRGRPGNSTLGDSDLDEVDWSCSREHLDAVLVDRVGAGTTQASRPLAAIAERTRARRSPISSSGKPSRSAMWLTTGEWRQCLFVR
jgi:hypothetical protein